MLFIVMLKGKYRLKLTYGRDEGKIMVNYSDDFVFK